MLLTLIVYESAIKSCNLSEKLLKAFSESLLLYTESQFSVYQFLFLAYTYQAVKSWAAFLSLDLKTDFLQQ